MVKQEMSYYTRKNLLYHLVVHKFFQGRHEDLNEFKGHVISFTDIKTVPHLRRLGKAFTYCPCIKNNKGNTVKGLKPRGNM